MAYEAYWGNVSVALRFDATPIVCDKGVSVTATDVDVDTSDNWWWPDGMEPDPVESFAVFNTASVSNVAIPAGPATDFGTAPFTLVWNFRRRSNSNTHIFGIGASPNDRVELYGGFGGTNITARVVAGGIQYTFAGSNPAPTQYVKHQLMLVRSGTSVVLMLDGAVLASGAIPIDAAVGLGDAAVLGFFNSIAGYLTDGFYIVKGVALETGAHTTSFDVFVPSPEPVTADIVGEITLSGELSGEHPLPDVEAVFSGAIALAGELQAEQPISARISGAIALSGDLQAGQPFFASIGGSLALSGTLHGGAGPVATISGPVSFGGQLSAGRGVAAACAGQLNLSGAAQVRHGRSCSIAGTLALDGELSAMYRQSVVADCLGEIALSGLMRGDYLLHPPGEQYDAITVFKREQRLTVNG